MGCYLPQPGPSAPCRRWPRPGPRASGWSGRQGCPPRKGLPAQATTSPSGSWCSLWGGKEDKSCTMRCETESATHKNLYPFHFIYSILTITLTSGGPEGSCPFGLIVHTKIRTKPANAALHLQHPIFFWKTHPLLTWRMGWGGGGGGEESLEKTIGLNIESCMSLHYLFVCLLFPWENETCCFNGQLESKAHKG